LFARLGLRVLTSFRFEPPGQPERAFQFVGDPGLIRLDPSWWEAARTFVGFGFGHILDGIDHLLFLFCLVLPLRRFWQLFGVVTSFTVAHSITLFCAAFGLAPSALWFPPFIEVMIAISIVYMAVENIVVAAKDVERALPPRQRRGPRRSCGGRPGLSEPLDDRVRVRPGARLRLLLCPSADAAVRRNAPGRVAVRIQRGCGAGTAAGALIALPLLALTFRYVVEERIGVIIASALVLHTAVALDDRARVGARDIRPFLEPIPAAGHPAARADGGCRLIGVGWILKKRR
jgi:hypothetical protein